MFEGTGTGTLLTKENNTYQAPLYIVTDDKALDEIKVVLQAHIKNEPSNARDDSSSILIPADDRVNNTTCTSITRTLQDQLKAANQKIADLNNTIETQRAENVLFSERKQADDKKIADLEQEKLLLRERNREEDNAS